MATIVEHQMKSHQRTAEPIGIRHERHNKKKVSQQPTFNIRTIKSDARGGPKEGKTPTL